MTAPSSLSDLSSPPDAEDIAELRTQASNRDDSVQVHFPASNGETKRFVVSPRGTCVVLNDTRTASFNPSVDAEDIAEALRDASSDE